MIVQFCEKYMVMIVTAAAGTLGYCLLINVKRNKIVYGCLGGRGIDVSLLCVRGGRAHAALAESHTGCGGDALCGGACPRDQGASDGVLIPSIIPLVPGGRLYYTMRAIVDGDADSAKIYAMETIVIALGIAVGIVVISLVFYHISHKNIQYKVRFEPLRKNWERGED